MCYKISDKTIVVVNPMIASNKSLEVTLSKFLRVIQPCYQSITVVGGNLSIEQDIKGVNLKSYPISRARSRIKRIFDNILLQIKMMFWILKTAHSGTPVFFWIADKMVLPFIAAKLKKAETNYFILGISAQGKDTLVVKFSSALRLWMAANANYVCVESTSVINTWKNLKSIPQRVIHLYTNHVNFSNCEDRKPIIGMVCRLAPEKHVIECIKAMINIHSKYTDWRLEILGTGYLLTECQNIIRENHAEEYISLMGWVEHGKTIDISKRWSFFILPSDTEGLPNGLIESLGLGIPSICSTAGGIPDVVRHNVNGFLLSNNTICEIQLYIEKAVKVKSNFQEYKIMAKEAYETIKQEYTLEAAQNCARQTLLSPKRL